MSQHPVERAAQEIYDEALVSGARSTGTYYRALRRSGVPYRLARQLVADWHRTMLGSSIASNQVQELFGLLGRMQREGGE